MTSRFHITGPVAGQVHFKAAGGQCNKYCIESNKLLFDYKDRVLIVASAQGSKSVIYDFLVLAVTKAEVYGAD